MNQLGQQAASSTGMGDGAASAIGGVFSLIMSVQFLDVAQQGLIAFMFGALGALGGWLMNEGLKLIKKKLKK